MVCSASISHITGFYAYALKQRLSCKKCVSALLHSREDPCPDRSLILVKNYIGNDTSQGLSYPSKPVCVLFCQAEDLFWKGHVSNKMQIEKLVSNCLLDISRTMFKSLQGSHSFDTSYRIENHYTSLVHLILKKYFPMRIKKSHKDQAHAEKPNGNALHRARIFQYKWILVNIASLRGYLWLQHTSMPLRRHGRTYLLRSCVPLAPLSLRGWKLWWQILWISYKYQLCTNMFD